MKGLHLGELEELALLAVGALGDEAYGVAVQEEIGEATGRTSNISAIHAVLTRLEKKRFLKSSMGGATNERGGRRKRIFSLTALGKTALEESMSVRSKLFNKVPGLTLKFSIA